MSAELVGTGRLLRLVLRRDRVRLSIWIVGLVGLMVVSAQSVAELYATPEQLAAYARTARDSPALVMFAGPGYGFDDPTSGAVLVNETSLWMALGVALMSVFLVNRHTRTEEETERTDLVRSLPVGRHAQLAAAVTVGVAANVVVAVGCTVVVSANGFPLAGTLALCASIGAVGVAATAIAACAAQIGATGRSSLGLATAAIGLAFAVRGIGDVAAPALSWLTPFGWAIGVRAYAHERWWTLAAPLALAAGLLAVAAALSVRRDLGAGLVAERPGPASAAPWVRRPLGLAWRLQRNAVAGWSVGIVAMGLVYGSVADDVDAMLADNPELADYLAQVSGSTLTESYLATAARIMALVVGGFAVSSTLRCRSEEAAGLAEPVLATPVTRQRWLLAHLVVTVGATALLVVVTGASVGTSYAIAIGDASQIGTMAVAATATFPALVVLIGIAAALFGGVPRASGGAWAALAFVAVVTLFGPVLRLPGWIVEMSPLAHAPAVPAESWRAAPVAASIAAGVGLVLVGLAAFRRRDLAPG